MTAYQRRMKSEGRCTQCGRKPVVNKNHCDPCRVKARDNNRRYVARGRVPMCLDEDE